ncbi:uncharacterized protein EKO05_0001801 [Ascochyta rabiei]|nr:uncharacterized protein EKO05_0001801 [Ascochyta rabiei]UPX11179.1 hypothetical protein EKO05_0001801 [Ascochyta rabiei]
MLEPSNSSSTPTSASFYEATDGDIIIKNLAPLLVQSAYACGSSVLVKERTKAGEEGITTPVTIRWDGVELTKKLTLPPSENTTSVKAIIQDLLETSQPASFGFKGQDVVDESYRKAPKLDPSAFSTNFCPYTAGIIDTIG